MKYIKYLFLATIIFIPFNTFAQPLTQNQVLITTTDKTDEEVHAYYDLRDRKSYIQVTLADKDVNICIHVQIFQQDKGCSELDFEDELTPNDTVIYDMDNIIRNNGTQVPINLDDDSYGFVAISSYTCNDRSDDNGQLLGNFRIIDNSGYEYRMNLITNNGNRNMLLPSNDNPPPASTKLIRNIIIPFNTVDGANHADIIAFMTDDDRNPGRNDEMFNRDAGITFSVFQVDENEEKLSCDQVTFACGEGRVMNYGINDDYPASRGDNLLCKGASLLPGQKHGYISLENPTYVDPINIGRHNFICLVGLNNENGTGSMDECRYQCIDDSNDCID
ncbi:MAG: hypothetical protein GTO02_21885 [Candidatus Dadabacteria bacterium]|nr:hypothetical protein [Candidatus Dadabacteria bacterium]NIQ16936.1 hypothetical protein [Candidatus Dadabacteria bacterium]